MEFDQEDMRAAKNYNALKKEKWIRKLINNVDEERGRKLNNKIANPSNYHKRIRSESPPPKSKRTNKGINKGHANACSFCRPEICNRFARKADTRKYMRELKKKHLRESI